MTKRSLGKKRDLPCSQFVLVCLESPGVKELDIDVSKCWHPSLVCQLCSLGYTACVLTAVLVGPFRGQLVYQLFLLSWSFSCSVAFGSFLSVVGCDSHSLVMHTFNKYLSIYCRSASCKYWGYNIHKNRPSSSGFELIGKLKRNPWKAGLHS